LSRLARGVEFVRDAVGGAAAQQVGVRDLARIRLVEFSDQCTLGIRRDGRNRAGARSEAEPMQDEHGTLGVNGHGVLSPHIEERPQAFTRFVGFVVLASHKPRQGLFKAASRNAH
jgi:hypothetical protein